jgi:hypothetical protein
MRASGACRATRPSFHRALSSDRRSGSLIAGAGSSIEGWRALPDGQTAAKTVPLGVFRVGQEGLCSPSVATDISSASRSLGSACGLLPGSPMSAYTTFGTVSPQSLCRAGTASISFGKALGHRQARTTERYAHLTDDPVRAVANRASERIAAIMLGDVGSVVPLAISSRHKPPT